MGLLRFWMHWYSLAAPTFIFFKMMLTCLDPATTLAIVCFIGVGVVGHKGEKPIDTLCEKEEGGCRAITSKSYALAIEMDADPKLDHEINEDTEKRGERQRVSYGGSIQEDELITPPDTPTTEPTSAPVTPPRLQH